VELAQTLDHPSLLLGHDLDGLDDEQDRDDHENGSDFHGGIPFEVVRATCSCFFKHQAVTRHGLNSVNAWGRGLARCQHRCPSRTTVLDLRRAHGIPCLDFYGGTQV
jgi:hypothetical protein